MTTLTRATAGAAAVVLTLTSPTDAGQTPPSATIAELAQRLVRAYHAGDTAKLEPHLAPDFRFSDPGLGQDYGLEEFLGMASEAAGRDTGRELEVVWTGATVDYADVRGRWSWTEPASGERREMVFSIELDFDVADGAPRVTSWLDDFRRRQMWKPAKGSGELATDNFRVVYFEDELSSEEATRLGTTLEHWYEKTSRFLGRSFEDGFRLHINVAGSHDVYASDPGPRAFILVPTHSAKLDYGFTLVHELTHNLMGLSWLTRSKREHDGVELYSGNRLFDEGFAVYVEEKLTGEGPEIWPNFGEETHAGYWRAREQKGEPIWPALEAEVHRERGDVRLAYLAQGSFVKYLIETHGLNRFERLFASDLDTAAEIYGRDFPELEREWRVFLTERFSDRSDSETEEAPSESSSGDSASGT